jgi:protein SCO1/2
MIRAAGLALALLLSARVAAVPPRAAVDIDEHLGAPLPLGLAFTDEDGRAVKLGDYVPPGQPLVLVLAYFRCPMLCDLVLRGVADAIARQGLVLGRDFRALTVSIDPKDTPAQARLKQHSLLQAMGAPFAAASWPFLVGAPDNIHTLAARLGFEYVYDAKSDQYAHPAVAFVITPDGRIARYLYGVQIRPVDLRLALAEAARGKIGGIVDRVLLTCFRYDPSTRRYAVYVRGVLRGGSALTLLLVGSALALLWRRERRRARHE